MMLVAKLNGVPVLPFVLVYALKEQARFWMTKRVLRFVSATCSAAAIK